MLLPKTRLQDSSTIPPRLPISFSSRYVTLWVQFPTLPIPYPLILVILLAWGNLIIWESRAYVAIQIPSRV